MLGTAHRIGMVHSLGTMHRLGEADGQVRVTGPVDVQVRGVQCR